MNKNNDLAASVTADALANWHDPRFAPLPEGAMRPKPLKPLTPQEELNLWADPRFGGVVDGAPGTKSGEELRSFMKNPDPEVLAELAKNDPKLAKKLRDKKIAEVADAFIRSTPAYYANVDNYQRLLENMLSRLLKEQFTSLEEAEEILAEAGIYTVANLTASYEILKAAGRLKAAPGTSKRLTAREERMVGVVLATAGIDKAIEKHLNLQFGGERPIGKSARDFLIRYPKEAARAVVFCWENARPQFTPSTAWSAFLSTKTRGRAAILTIAALDAFWNEFQKTEQASAFPASVPSVPTEPEKLLEDMTDEEVEQRLLAARRERARSSRRS